MSLRRLAATAGAALGLVGVVMGAVGSHLLPGDAPTGPDLWRTALQMHLFHAAALLALSGTAPADPSPALRGGTLALLLGTVLFSGSLYLRAAGLAWLPPWVAPAGGTLLILGWLSLVAALARARPG
jgi:uncharacterized membrane protein YgdD (TMEM256/DUF423 family)